MSLINFPNITEPFPTPNKRLDREHLNTFLMTKTNKGFVSLYISLVTLILIFNGCENPGSVGDSYIEEPTVAIDTLLLDNISVENFQGYSGNLEFFSIGKYADQAFGEIKATGMLKPIRFPTTPDTVSVDGNNFSMALELQLDSTNTYGDTLSVSGFTIYEITSLWRGNSQRINTGVTYNEATEIGSFTIGQESSILINLADSWKDKYASYANSTEANIDSLYRREFLGLAIVPNENTNKISFPAPLQSRFLMISDNKEDTVGVGIESWAYDLQRTSNPLAASLTSLHSTVENLMKIQFPLSQIRNEYRSSNLLKAELIFYEAKAELEASLPADHSRVEVNSIRLDQPASTQEVYRYQISQPRYTGSRDSDNPYFRANITSYFNNVFFGGLEEDELYMGPLSSSGIIRSTLIYNQSASPELRPKLIITTIVNEEN